MVSSHQREQLLKTTSAGCFLALLRGSLTYRDLADQLALYGGPASRGAVCNLEKGLRSPSRQTQRAYQRVFGFEGDLELRAHLQDLSCALLSVAA